MTDMAAHLQTEAQGIGRRRRTPHIRRTPLARPAQECSHRTVMRRLRSHSPKPSGWRPPRFIPRQQPTHEDSRLCNRRIVVLGQGSSHTATSRQGVLRTKRWIQGRTTSSGSSRFLDQPSSTRRAAASPGPTRAATGSTLRVAVQPHQQRTCFSHVSIRREVRTAS